MQHCQSHGLFVQTTLRTTTNSSFPGRFWRNACALPAAPPTVWSNPLWSIIPPGISPFPAGQPFVCFVLFPDHMCLKRLNPLFHKGLRSFFPRESWRTRNASEYSTQNDSLNFQFLVKLLSISFIGGSMGDIINST